MTDNSVTDGYQPHHSSFNFPHHEIVLKITDNLAHLIYEDSRIIGFDWGYKQILFDCQDVVEMNKILPLINGSHTIASIIQQSALLADTVQTILQTFYEIGTLELVSNDAMPAQAFYRHTVARMRAKRHRMLQDNPIIKPGITRDQLLGFLIDSYHFAAAASSHISLAIAQAPNKKVEYVLSHYLAEEYWHGQLLSKGIIKAGIDKHTLRQSWPSFPVLGIINFIRHQARTDLQAYGLCTSITESETGSVTLLGDKADSWDVIKALQLLPDETLAVFQEHEKLDYDANHANVPEVMFSNQEMISFERQQQLVSTVEGYIMMVGDAYRYLNDFYARPHRPLWFQAA